MIVKHFTFMYDYIYQILNGNLSSYTQHLIGGRWSGKSQSIYITICKLLFINEDKKFKNKRIRINWLRNEVNGAEENFSEILENLSDLNLYYLVNIDKKKRKIKYKDVIVRFIGYLSNRNKDVKKLGIQRYNNVDININIFEEIFEFSNYDDISKIEQAIGSSKKNITFCMTNTWDGANWYLSSLLEKMEIKDYKYNTKLMEKNGYNHFVIIKNNDNVEIIDWTNHKVNEYLSNLDHKRLLDMWNIDPLQAAIVERGDMGVREDGIYTRAFRKVNNIPADYNAYQYYVGCDYGKSRDATTFHLQSNSYKYKQFSIHKEYYHSHKEKKFTINGRKLPFVPKDITDYARDLVDLCVDWAKRLGYGNNRKIPIRIDYSAALDQVVQNEIFYRKVDNYIYIERCIKPSISLRINVIIMLMATGCFFINKKNCPNLVNEFLNATYIKDAENKLSLKKEHYDMIRLDGKDHCINSIEYGISEKFFEVRNQNRMELWNNGIKL